MNNEVIEEYGFQEVYLLHNKCVAESRSQCDPSVVFGGRRFKNGVIAANMSSVVNEATCKFLAKNGMFYIMHRFDVDNCSFVKEMHREGLFASISIGVNDDTKEQLLTMKSNNVVPEYITLDIANSYSVKSERMVKLLKRHLLILF